MLVYRKIAQSFRMVHSKPIRQIDVSKLKGTNYFAPKFKPRTQEDELPFFLTRSRYIHLVGYLIALIIVFGRKLSTALIADSDRRLYYAIEKVEAERVKELIAEDLI